MSYEYSTVAKLIKIAQKQNLYTEKSHNEHSHKSF